MVGLHPWDSRDMSLSRFQKLVMGREAWCAAVYRVTKSQTWISDWTELNSEMFSPWKESYEKSRKHVKNHKLHFAYRGPYSQRYDFFSSHVWMWELKHKEGWELLCRPLLFLPSIFPSIKVFQMSQLFTSGGQSIGISASASVLSMNILDWFPLGWTGWVPWRLKDSQESSTSQFKSINSSVLSFIYSPALTSMHDNWKNHSFD